MYSLLLRAPNWIGDAVMAMPLIQGLASAEEVSSLTVLARPPIAELTALMDLPGITILTEPGKFSFSRTSKLIKGKFDLAFTLSPSFASLAPILLKGISPIFGITSRETTIFIKNGIPGYKPEFRKTHLMNTYLTLAEIAGIRLSSTMPIMKVNHEIMDIFGLVRGKYYILAPAAQFGPAKMWPVEHFAAAATHLSSTGLKGIILGGTEDSELGTEIIRLAGDIPLVDLSGKTTLTQASSIIAGARFSLANDSGLMHLSYINGTRTYGLFGSTAPLWTGPKFNSFVFYSGRECSPCFAKECRFGHYGCLKDITPLEVAQLIIKETELG